MSAEKFQALQNTWSDAYYAHKPSLTPLKAWIQNLDSELDPALKELLRNPETFFYFGSFNDPQDRISNITRVTDEGAGLRLIGQLFLEKNGERRFLSFLTFWKYDTASRKLVLVSKRDAVRVRAQIGPKEFAGLSYRVTKASGGKIQKRPGVYRTDDGKVRYQDIGQAANPDHCNVCHREPQQNREDTRVYDTTDYDSFDGLNSFLKFYRAQGVDEAELMKIKNQLEAPRAFLREYGF